MNRVARKMSRFGEKIIMNSVINKRTRGYPNGGSFFFIFLSLFLLKEREKAWGREAESEGERAS